jgi:hypothetical protein
VRSALFGVVYGERVLTRAENELAKENMTGFFNELCIKKSKKKKRGMGEFFRVLLLSSSFVSE